jgi:hypothetical protein
MGNKKLIQIIIIVGGFVGAAIVLYNGFFKKEEKNFSLNPGVQNMETGNFSTQNIQNFTVEKLLPNGEKLDLSILNKKNLRFGLLKIPSIQDSDIGIPANQLIKSVSKSK